MELSGILTVQALCVFSLTKEMSLFLKVVVMV